VAEMLYRTALHDALVEEMDRDEKVYLMGEDIGRFGGAYRVTDGLLDKYGEMRVVDTPIAEEVIVGCAIGSAMLGLRPVVEMMTVNFSLVAFDQIVQSAAKIRYMFGGQATVPLVIRMPGGAGHQLSAQHSHSFEALYGMIPGVLVVAPTTPEDAKGLLKSAIRTPNPVMFLESMSLYNMKGEVPEQEYLTPIGKAAVRREGRDLTIVGVSRQAVLAQLDQPEAILEALAGYRRRGVRDQDLATMACAHQACRAVQGGPVVVTVALLRLAGMDAHADLQRLVLPRFVEQRPLRLDRGVDCVVT